MEGESSAFRTEAVLVLLNSLTFPLSKPYLLLPARKSNRGAVSPERHCSTGEWSVDVPSRLGCSVILYMRCSRDVERPGIASAWCPMEGGLCFCFQMRRVQPTHWFCYFFMDKRRFHTVCSLIIF